MNQEIEIKFIVDSKVEISKRLNALCAKLVQENTLMRMSLFDYKNREEMNATGLYRWFRVRDEGNKITMNVKEMFDDGRTKDDHVKEVELIVDNYEAACKYLETLELEKTGNQEKYREMWRFEDVDITIDQWPALPLIIELEGKSEEKLLQIATKLGFQTKDAIRGSVDYVYQNVYGIDINKMGEDRDLTFENEEEIVKKFKDLSKK